MPKARAGVALLAGLLLTLTVAAVPAAARSRARVTVTRVSASSGPTRGGNRISVWGSGFRHVRRVIFGGTRGRSVHVLSSHHLTVVVPAHRALTVHVKVYTATARSYRRAADRYTYVGRPEITSISPAGDAVKGGRRVRITGDNFHAPTTVLFGSLRGKAVWVANSHLLTVTVPAHATGAVHVRVVTRYGMSRATGADEFSYHPPPVVSGAPPVLPSTDVAIHLTGSGFDPQTEVYSGATEVATRVESAGSLWASLIAVTPGAHTLTIRTPWGATTARYSVYQAAATTLAVTLEAGGHADLSWTPPVEPYPVWSTVLRTDRSTPPAGGATPIGRVAGSALTDESVVPGHTYSYAIIEDDGHGHTSTPVSTTVTVPRDPVTTLGVPELLDPPTGSPVAISCTATQCVEIDAAGAARTYDGVSWSDPVPTGGHPARPYDLSCADSSFCAALDADGAGVVWDGHDWTRLPKLNVKAYVSGVSCPVAGWCVATGDQGEAAILSGGSWHEVQLGPHPWNDVSCASTASCLAVGMDGSVARYDGASWSVQAMPLTGMHWTAVSCATTSWCTALGYEGGTTSYAAVWTDGQWSAPTLVDGAHRGLTLDCPAVGMCVAASLNAYAVALANGTWSQPQRVEASNYYLALGCLSAVACVGVGSGGQGKAATFDGTTWSAASVFDPPHARITDLSCAADDFCAIVDGSGYAALRTAGVWSQPTRVTGAVRLDTVSCASPTLCLAAGVFRDSAGVAYAGMAWFNGQGWSAPFSAGAGIVYLNAVSCPTEQFCMAVGGANPAGLAQTWDGQSWSDPVPFDPDTAPLTLSCASDTFCMAGENDAVWRWANGTWTRDRPSANASFSVAGISCFNDASCLIASHSGDLARWDGTQWTATPGRTTGNVLSLACTSSTYCLATQGNASIPRIVDFDGSSWSTPDRLPSLVDASASSPAIAACGGTTCYVAMPDGRIVSTSH